MSTSTENRTKPVTTEAEPSPAIRRRLGELPHRYGLIGVWAVVVAVFCLLRPDTYATLNNVQTTLSINAINLILALSIVPSLAVAEYDLSIGGVMGLALVLCGDLNITEHWPAGAAVAAAIAACLAVGLINAFCIIVLEIDSIVVTLGMGTLLAGIALGIDSLPLSGLAQSVVSVSRAEVGGIQLVFVYGLVLTILLWYVLSHTPLGRYLYFIGEGRNVARLSGLRVDLIRAGALICSSVLAGVAGVLQAGVLGGDDPTVGPTMLLPAFAAAFLGGSAITPGRFNAWGTFVAVYFLASGIVGLELIGLSGWIEQVFYGAALIFAVATSRVLSQSGREGLKSRAAWLRALSSLKRGRLRS